MKKNVWFSLFLSLGVVACNASPIALPNTPMMGGGMGNGMGNGMGGGMMARHSAPIPEAYAALTNPVTADAASLERGGTVYTTYCATCHGAGGMGDGPASVGLDPAPAPIAHTSQMLGDNYLFWRISEGGVPFSTTMPMWKAVLDETARWDVINYMRALGQGQVTPSPANTGAVFDPQAEAQHRATMLATAVAQNVITQAEADTFTMVHTALDTYLILHPAPAAGTVAERQAAMLTELVKAGTITQAEAEAFTDIHNRLGAAGVMP